MTDNPAPIVCLTRQRLRAHRFGSPKTTPPCGCPTWGLLEREQQDLTLDGFMQWSWIFYRVHTKLLVHDGHVGIHEVSTPRPGQGRVRQVMFEFCLWADCARTTLELTPTDEWGADINRLKQFYTGLGFEHNTEDLKPLVYQGEMIRHPIAGRRHVRP